MTPGDNGAPIAPAMLIDGEAVRAEETLEVLNPATERPVGTAPRASRAQLDRAVAAARAAFTPWKRRPIGERQAAVAAFGRAIGANVPELAALLTAEQGKPLADATREVAGAAMWMQAVATHDLPVTVLEESATRRVEQRHVPLGVVAAIAPWNFPIMLAHWKVAPALLAGNTVLLKPSPFTPLTTLRIAELVREIMPPGVYNVVTGGDELGPWMTSHPGIDKVSFTGSTATGRRVMESASATLKRVTLELGGNDAAIVLPDADLDHVVPDLFWAAFRNSGQICIAAKRIYVHSDIYDRFRDAFVAFARTVPMGDGAADGTALGPVQNVAQYRRVLDLIDDCRTNEHRFALGGDPVPETRDGYFIPVTIVDNPPDDSRIVTEEPFGPVVPLLRFDDVDDVVSRANASPYGLAGSVWSADPVRALAVAEQLDTGTVWINECQYLTPFQPFGGHKQSGLGVESGRDGLLEYTNTQVITIRSAPAAMPPVPAAG